MHRPFTLAAVAFVGLALFAGGVPVSASDRDDWPQFRGAGGAGVAGGAAAPVEWGPDKNVVWKTELPGAGASSPVLFGDRIYLTAYSGYGVPGAAGGDVRQLKRHLLCLDRVGGKVLWTRDVDAAQPEQERVREDHGYATNTPAVDGERVYVFFGKSGVFAFDHEGNRQWHADAAKLSPGCAAGARERRVSAQSNESTVDTRSFARPTLQCAFSTESIGHFLIDAPAWAARRKAVPGPRASFWAHSAG